MIVGVIYKYTSPSGRAYIGQTTNEAHRRSTWFCLKQHYAGEAIDNAREKYGPENFKYEVLYKKEYSNIKEAANDLDKWECYYIGYYDTYHNGYNLTLGGDLTNRGVVRTEEWREKQRQAQLGHITSEETKKKLSNSLKGKKHSDEANQSSRNKRRASGRHIKIGQYDANYNLVKIWANGMEASETLGIDSANIYRATRTFGKYMGFYWRKYYGEQMCEPKPKKKIEHISQRKQIVQKTLDGYVVCIHNSVSSAARSLGKDNIVLINKALHGRTKAAYGYIWEYLNCA